ncbi:PREDICTED: uncharacterized protein LOC108977138 isoform X1 [Bactrocera latifrons]|uniref:uncharacterized protein LOC108977138 isoform X1 n=1 Tax=Bactrocera latifrons TaxID=174628 RepID=UPI0008DC6B60|nr:PREDICTED: uncharacterized protein LOC108977138 isoform X1 [Bactrocera latifrons]
MSPAHISSPMASSPTVSAQQQQLQHQPLQIQQHQLHQPPQQPPTPTSTPSHHLANILNETATSKGSSTLAVVLTAVTVRPTGLSTISPPQCKIEPDSSRLADFGVLVTSFRIGGMATID